MGIPIALLAMTAWFGEREALEAALTRHRAIAAAGGWPRVSHARDPALPARLNAEGDPSIEDFQRRHGLAADGLVGPATLAELNASAAWRVRQLEANLERIPENLPERYVRVNIPAYELEVRVGDNVELTSRVVVGRANARTPRTRLRITQVKLNPYWVAPVNLAHRDLLPRLRKDVAAMIRDGFHCLTRLEPPEELDLRSLDWKTVTRLPCTLRQDPGPKNPMGQISFRAPNPFDVCLHDTPERALFERPARAASSGCVRVERAAALAAWMLGQTEQRILAWVADREPLDFDLAEPVPLLLEYRTAWVDGRGGVQFRRDIYGLDRELAPPR